MSLTFCISALRRELKYSWLVTTFLLLSVSQLLAQNPDLKMLKEEDQAVRHDKQVTRTDEDRIKVEGKN